MNSLQGKVAIVTGAAGSGLGRSIALTLAREGAKVVVNYRTSRTQAEALVHHMEKEGGQAVAVPADVHDASGCRDLVGSAITHFGRIDICIIGPGGGWHAESVDQLSASDALQDVQQETAPLLHLMPLVLPGMYERHWGRIIGLSMHPRKLSPAYAYNLGKAARTEGLLLAVDQAWPHGVTLNVIAPGPLEPLPTLENAIEQCAHGQAWQNRDNISPQDVAEGVAFLCSDAGRFISGCVLTYLFNR